MDDWSDEDAIRTFGWVRILAGAVLLLLPRLGTKVWTNEDTSDATTDLALRGMGVRDVALGVGLVTSLEKGAPVRGWLEAGALVDAGDAFATLTSWRDLGRIRGLFFLATEVASAYYGSQLAARVD